MVIVEDDDFCVFWNLDSEKENNICNLYIVRNEEAIFFLPIKFEADEQLNNDEILDYLRHTYIDYCQLYEKISDYALEYLYITKLFNCFQEL